MIGSYFQKLINENSPLKDQAKAALRMIKENSLSDQELIVILNNMLISGLPSKRQEVISNYCQKDLGNLRYTSNRIYIDHIPIFESDTPTIFDNEKANDKLKLIKNAFDMSNAKCCFPKCSSKPNTYCKIRIEGGNHKSTCVYCFACFARLCTTYMNIYIVAKDDARLWKCICKEPIAEHYYNSVLSGMLDDYYSLQDKLQADPKTHQLFCVVCRKLTKHEPLAKTGQVTCKEHST